VEWLEAAIQWFAERPDHPLGFAFLFLSAGIEYICPPFPGDTITLAGAWFVGRHGWSLPLVFAAVAAGSVAGAALDFLFGRKLHAWREGKDRKLDRALASILRGFKRWGIWLIAVNRFLPGIRAFFFVAAGMAGFRLIPVLALACVSALLWNVLIFAIGFYAAKEWDRMKSIIQSYEGVMWVVIAAGVAAILWRFLRRRRAAAESR